MADDVSEKINQLKIMSDNVNELIQQQYSQENVDLTKINELMALYFKYQEQIFIMYATATDNEEFTSEMYNAADFYNDAKWDAYKNTGKYF